MYWENVMSCLLFDVWLCGESGLVFQQVLDWLLILIVVIMGFVDVEVCCKVLKGGVVDFFVKLFIDYELIDVVNLVLLLDVVW